VHGNFRDWSIELRKGTSVLGGVPKGRGGLISSKPNRHNFIIYNSYKFSFIKFLLIREPPRSIDHTQHTRGQSPSFVRRGFSIAMIDVKNAVNQTTNSFRRQRLSEWI